MSNSKAIKSATKAIRAAKPAGRTIARASSANAKYVVPATTVALGSSVLAGGFMMRKRLIAAASAIADRLSMDDVLRLMGMQRRRGIWEKAAPALGALAAGAFIGAGLAIWLTPVAHERGDEVNTTNSHPARVDSTITPHA
jgi:hypothetical protein